MFAVISMAGAASATPPSFLEAKAISAYGITPAGFTVECFIRVRSLPGFNPLIVHCASRDARPCEAIDRGYWDLGICKLSDCSPGTVSFFMQGDGKCLTVRSVSRVDDGAWHHVAASYDGEGIRIHVDGKREGHQPATSMRVNLVQGVLTVGNRAGHDSPFDGEIDELRIWREARGESDIREFMRKELNPVPGAVAGYWPFNGSTDDLSKWKNRLVKGNYILFRKGRLGRSADIINTDTLRGEGPGSPSTPFPGGDETGPEEGMRALDIPSPFFENREAGFLD